MPARFEAGFWPARLVAPEVAPAVVPLHRPHVDAPAAVLVRATRDPAYRRRAGALGARVRAEDGTTPVLARCRPRPGPAGRLRRLGPVRARTGPGSGARTRRGPPAGRRRAPAALRPLRRPREVSPR